MDSGEALLGPSWTTAHKLSPGLGGMNGGTGALSGSSSSPTGLLPSDPSAGAMAGLGSQYSSDSGAGNPTDPSSVLLLQQNLQRLYGSLGQVAGMGNGREMGQSASRTSLHSILEDLPEGAVPERSPPASFMGADLRNGSEEDLFLMDGPAATNANGTSTPPNAAANGALPAGSIGETRTLFIRGIDPVMPDDVIREYLECFGDIHSLYTASKHRGYVMVTYHDIRAARLAQNTVHGQTWRGSQVSSQFSAESGSGSGGVTAALLIVALDGGASLDNAFYMLSAYGEMKELRREPNRPNIALCEFYDARHAEAALKGMAASPDLSKRLMAIDAGPSLSNLPAAFSDVAASWDTLVTSGGMHQPVGVHGDLSAVTRSLQDISLQSNSSGAATTASQPDLSNSNAALGGVGSGLNLNDLAVGRSASSTDLFGMPMPNRPSNTLPMRGIQSTGSLALWAQQQQQQQGQLGTSPLNNISWGPIPGLQQDLLVAQQQAAAVAVLQQNAALLQQQQQVAQNAAVQAALQQALMNQQVAAVAAFGLQVNNRRGFSEPALGGRLARRPMDPAAEAERRAQQERLYGLDLQRIAAGEDKRTTLMVKNIPNKYTQKMLLTLIEERFAGINPIPFDFFYLPIDFKNRCNVGYAFINMTTPHAIPALVEEFHGRRWPKFNSEKICRIAYARIQGKNALVQHFQNSSLLHEDKRCRPVLFGPNGEVETFPMAGEV